MSIDRLLGYINEFPNSEYWTEARMISVIKELDDHAVNLKSCQKLMKEKLFNIKIKNYLQIDHRSDLLSVRCDGKTITVSFLGGAPDTLEKGILKRLGFSFNKFKMDYTRKVLGLDVEALRGFIGEVESD